MPSPKHQSRQTSIPNALDTMKLEVNGAVRLANGAFPGHLLSRVVHMDELSRLIHSFPFFGKRDLPPTQFFEILPLHSADAEPMAVVFVRV